VTNEGRSVAARLLRDEASAVAADLTAVQRMAAGDESGFAALYDRHATAIYSLALRITRRAEEAEDVTQQVFTQAWRTSVRYESARGAVAAWLLMMARSRAIDSLRRRDPARPGTSDDAELAAIPDPEPDVEYVMATREQIERVRVAIDALPEEQRIAVELAYYDGLTQREIAARTATPLGTVKTRVRGALQSLRIVVAGTGRPAAGQS
jgi:RNA polymerase sigma-70 factor (ECF subfamily)